MPEEVVGSKVQTVVDLPVSPTGGLATNEEEQKGIDGQLNKQGNSVTDKLYNTTKMLLKSATILTWQNKVYYIYLYNIH